MMWTSQGCRSRIVLVRLGEPSSWSPYPWRAVFCDLRPYSKTDDKEECCTDISPKQAPGCWSCDRDELWTVRYDLWERWQDWVDRPIGTNRRNLQLSTSTDDSDGGHQYNKPKMFVRSCVCGFKRFVLMNGKRWSNDFFSKIWLLVLGKLITKVRLSEI